MCIRDRNIIFGYNIDVDLSDFQPVNTFKKRYFVYLINLKNTIFLNHYSEKIVKSSIKSRWKNFIDIYKI
mgnify:CR=1 FL=1